MNRDKAVSIAIAGLLAVIVGIIVYAGIQIYQQRTHEVSVTHFLPHPELIHQSGSGTVKEVRPQYQDDYWTSRKVEEAINKCGMSDSVSRLDVYLHECTSADIAKQQARVNSIHHWAEALPDDVLQGMYFQKLDKIQKNIDDAKDELVTHSLAKEQSDFASEQAQAEKIVIPVPPCDPDIPLGFKPVLVKPGESVHIVAKGAK